MWIIIMHQVASFVQATLKCSFGTTGPLLRTARAQLVSTAKQSTRWKHQQLQWEDRPAHPGISIKNHADHGRKTPCCSSHSEVLFWHNCFSFEGQGGRLELVQRQLQWEDRGVRLGISISNHADCGKRRHLVTATLKRSLSRDPSFEGWRGLVSQSQVGLNCKQDIRWKRQLQWEDPPACPGRSQLTTMQ
jgi:hypothetical protein